MINIGNKDYGRDISIRRGRSVWYIHHIPSGQLVKVSPHSRETYSSKNYAQQSLDSQIGTPNSLHSRYHGPMSGNKELQDILKECEVRKLEGL